MALIELINISKDFGKQNIKPLMGTKEIKQGFSIKNLNLTVPDGKTMVILGPSGCGKTTLLKLIAGLEQPNNGTIKFNGTDMAEIQPSERKIGMVFQNYALYPHLTSENNITSFFFFKKKTPELDDEKKAKFKKTSELLGVEMEYLLDKNPAQLSGGEKQRVAIGRCITRDPSIFLLDEPFSNLDAKLREKYRVELKKLLRQFSVTTVYVTHDQQEALILADILTVMKDGEILQTGTYEEIYNNPVNLFAAEFLNPNSETKAVNILDGGTISETLKEKLIGVRPNDIVLHHSQTENSLKGVVTYIQQIPIRNSAVVSINTCGGEVMTGVPLTSDFKENREVWLTFKKQLLFDKISGNRL